MNVDINNMPEAIKDDCLRDTMVAVSFHSDFSKDYLEGLVLKGMMDRYGEGSFNKIPLVVNGAIQDGLWFYANNQFRIMVDNNSISFNIVQRYPKWGVFGDFIKYVLSLLADRIVSFNEVSLRYVSFFGERELSEMIDGTLKMNQLIAFAGAQYRFQCNVNDNSGKSIANAEVQLSDRYQLSDEELSSIIDIRVWRDFQPGMNVYDNVVSSLELVHRHQKHLFFLLLSEPFYNELKV